jgi:hypothetical protein
MVTTQDKIRAIVQAMIDGGWRPDTKQGCYNYNGINDNKIVITCTLDRPKSEWSVYYYYHSLPDLIFNPDAMRAAYGDEKVFKWITAYEFHAHRALALSHEGGDYVDYLYQKLPDKEKDK